MDTRARRRIEISFSAVWSPNKSKIWEVMAAIRYRSWYGLAGNEKGEMNQWPMEGNDQGKMLTALEQGDIEYIGVGGWGKGVLVNY